MFPEDRVLVGVINRKRDLLCARDRHWYRIPQKQFMHGVGAEYLAFFLSRAFKEQNGGIHYYAPWRGLELVYRRDLLPAEPDHPRAGDVYYKVQIGDLLPKVPPILNTTRRTVSFIYTTWDRFVHAREVADLYSRADYFVDRIYHTLRSKGIPADRWWEAEGRQGEVAPRLRILCENGTVVASTTHIAGGIFLDYAKREDTILEEIRAAIALQGGPVMLNIPLEGE